MKLVEKSYNAMPQLKCICKKCGRVNVFPAGINPETYGWTFLPDDSMLCFSCEPEGGEE